MTSRLAAREDQAKSAAQAADTRVTQAQQQIAVLGEQLKQARLTVDQSRLDAQGRVRQAEAQVATGGSEIWRRRRPGMSRPVTISERFTRLASSGDVPDRQREQARTTAAAQAAVVESEQETGCCRSWSVDCG